MISRGSKLKKYTVLVALVALVFEAALVSSCSTRKALVLKGAVIRADEDPNKESPIAGAQVSAAKGLAPLPVRSDANGFFRITLRPDVRPGQPVVLEFRHADYRPLDATDVAGDQLYLAHMVPIPHPAAPVPNHPEVSISNVRLRFSEKTKTLTQVGTEVKTFTVVNAPNVPCNGRAPCSPDGLWKATINFTTLDAGEGNEFRNARVSCVAGPCPFTMIEHDGFSRGGRFIGVSVRDWSATTTFLIEADVVRPAISDRIQHTYPMILGDVFNFSLPGAAEGPSIEADVNGDSIVFPLGPALCLPWADCEQITEKDGSRAYRCQLKGGYRMH